MIPQDARNPFRPGAGHIPPVFPGRETEQDELNRCIRALSACEAPARDRILRLTLKDIRSVRHPFYQGRYDRLKKRQLVPAATELAAHFAQQPMLHEDKVEEILDAIGGSAGQTAGSMQDELINEGYIWRADLENQFHFHPGIPSLMDYIKTQG